MCPYQLFLASSRRGAAAGNISRFSRVSNGRLPACGAMPAPRAARTGSSHVVGINVASYANRWLPHAATMHRRPSEHRRPKYIREGLCSAEDNASGHTQASRDFRHDSSDPWIVPHDIAQGVCTMSMAGRVSPPFCNLVHSLAVPTRFARRVRVAQPASGIDATDQVRYSRQCADLRPHPCPVVP